MPRYRSTSPFEQVLMGLSVGQPGVTVWPADGRPEPVDGSTVVLGYGDEIATDQPIHFPGAYEVDAPTTATPVTAPTTTEENPQP